ncbi:MAG: ROK family protein [Elusimicrobia bacterium]|nr:ROK family protein [Elusimicrobiota bacterium]
MLIVGIDIGGTKIMAGLIRLPSDASGKAVILKKVEQPTAKKRESAITQITSIAAELIQNEKSIKGMGVAAPGPMDAKRGVLLRAPNLSGWENIRLKSLLEKKFRVPVALENDANAAALAEALWGAGKGKRHVLFATISTGIGTGLVIDGRLYRGATGFALEGGHLTIDRNGASCNCGQKGCIEAYASGPAIAKRARKVLVNAPPALSSLYIEKEAKKGNAACKKLIEDAAFDLGLWLGNMVNLFDPDVIVLGGGVTSFGKHFFDVIKQTLPKFSVNPKANEIPVIPAKLGRDMGIFGAAAIFWESRQ